jgi:hypothetical protein
MQVMHQEVMLQIELFSRSHTCCGCAAMLKGRQVEWNEVLTPAEMNHNYSLPTMTDAHSNEQRKELSTKLSSYTERIKTSRSPFDYDASVKLLNEVVQFSNEKHQDGSMKDLTQSHSESQKIVQTFNAELATFMSMMSMMQMQRQSSDSAQSK